MHVVIRMYLKRGAVVMTRKLVAIRLKIRITVHSCWVQTESRYSVGD